MLSHTPRVAREEVERRNISYLRMLLLPPLPRHAGQHKERGEWGGRLRVAELALARTGEVSDPQRRHEGHDHLALHFHDILRGQEDTCSHLPCSGDCILGI
jgi:hypothetical protein